jgi:carbon storage regulator
MLVLSRKKDERIVIAGGEIVLTIMEIRGDKVRVGIAAAKDISVHRGEVQDALDAAVISAGATNARR